MSAIPCRVWAFANDCGLEAAELAVLDAEERAHAARLKGKTDRDAFIKTRAALRNIVGRESGVQPRDVAFRYNSWGKPSVAVTGQPTIDFSVSHTRGLSAIALARGAAVGIDVEPLRICSDRVRIAADVFGVDVAQQLLAVESSRQDAVFLALWTAGEALVKAQGSGFAGTNGKVPVRLAENGSGCAVLRDDLKSRWSLAPLELRSEFVGHVVVGARTGVTEHDGSLELRVAAGFGSR